MPLVADVLQEKQADEENRHRHAGDRQGHDAAIDDPALVDGGDRADGDADGDGPDQTGDHQFRRRPDGRRQLGEDGRVVDHRLAEIAVRDAGYVAPELNDRRLVQPHLLADLLDDVRGCGRPRDHHGWIAGRQLDEEKTEDEDAKQHGHRQHQTIRELLAHARQTSPASSDPTSLQALSAHHGLPGIVLKIHQLANA